MNETGNAYDEPYYEQPGCGIPFALALSIPLWYFIIRGVRRLARMARS